MPNLAPKNSKGDPRRRYKRDRRNNVYYDENTIKQRYYWEINWYPIVNDVY